MAAYSYSISLRLSHPSMDPRDMTAALAMQLHNCWRAGELRVTRKGVALKGTNPESFWTGPADKGAWPPTTLASGIDAALEFFDEQSGDALPVALLAKAAGLGIDLSFDIYAQ